MFFKKKTMNREELELQIFKTKIELRRIMEKYEVMLQRELRIARGEQAAGVSRPSNYEKLRTIAALLATTKKAHQQMDSISTADELNRTTAELSAALQSLNRIAGSAQRPDRGNLRRGIKKMQAADDRLERDLKSQPGNLTDAEVESLLVDGPVAEEQPLTDIALDGDLLSWLEEI